MEFYEIKVLSVKKCQHYRAIEIEFNKFYVLENRIIYIHDSVDINSQKDLNIIVAKNDALLMDFKIEKKAKIQESKKPRRCNIYLKKDALEIIDRLEEKGVEIKMSEICQRCARSI